MASLKVKELLCVLYSALLFISGALLIGFSVVLSIKIFYHFKFIPASSIGPFIVLFLLGFIHLLLTWLGVRGPTREHDIHIVLFMVITIVLLLAECAVGVWSVILWDEVDIESLQLMKKSFDELLKSDFDKKDWARLESQLGCCGLEGVHAYQERKGVIPTSCCNKDSQDKKCDYYEVGCSKPLARYIKHVLIDAAIMGFSCSVFHAIGIFAFYTFFKAMKKERSARIQRRLAAQRTLSQDGASANPTPSAPPPISPPTSAK